MLFDCFFMAVIQVLDPFLFMDPKTLPAYFYAIYLTFIDDETTKTLTYCTLVMSVRFSLILGPWASVKEPLR